jgi:Cu-processing system ATP-binding protein
MIRFEAFTKTYGSQHAVHSLTLAVARGEIVALLGPNGSGKSTTLKAAAGLVRPSSGSVTIGEPPENAMHPEARRRLSYLPQRVAFPESLTGRDVVEFYRSLRGAPAARTAEVLKFAALNGSSDRSIGGYSGGMTQRLGLAVAMVPDADVLLLDEPTAALDADGLSAFYDLMDARRANGGTVLFTSHQIDDVERVADRFVVLMDGRLVASLSRAELNARLGVRSTVDRRLDALYRRLIDGSHS